MNTLREIAEETHELEMTPLIDVTFLLLVFFLLTLKFKVLEGKLSAHLPPDVGAAPGAAVDEPVEIAVEVVPGSEGQRVFASGDGAGRPWRAGSDRRFTIRAGTRALRYIVGPRRLEDLDALRARLATLHAADPERRVSIDAGAGTFIGDVVPVLDLLIELGFEDVRFEGERADLR